MPVSVSQLEEFKKRKAFAAAKRAGTPSLTPQKTPLVTPIKAPEGNSKAQTPAIAPKVLNDSARSAVPAGLPQGALPASEGKSLQNQQPLTSSKVLQPAAASKPLLKGKGPVLPAQAIAPAKDQAAPPQKPHQPAAYVPPLAQKPYENGNDTASSMQSAVSPAVEQQRVFDLENQLLDRQRQHNAEMQKVQSALSEKESGLQALQAQVAAANRVKDNLSQELAQERADKEEHLQSLQHMQAEHQRLSDARSLEWQSATISLQGQVETLAQQVADLQDKADAREEGHGERVAALQATIERLSGEAETKAEERLTELEAKCAALEEQVSATASAPFI